MILQWYFFLHFLEKSHFAKVLNINDIILYLCRRMIHWDFFREKTFLLERLSLSFVPQFSAERNNFFIKTSCYFIFLLYLCIGYRSKIRMVPKTLWVKTKAFAIISRLAKSLGNSIWNKKHENNMWQVARIVASGFLRQRCTRYRRGAFLEDSGAPFRGRPVLNAIRGITPFLYPIAFCGLIVGCVTTINNYGK